MKKPLDTVYKLFKIVDNREKNSLILYNLLVGDPNFNPPKKLLTSLENSIYGKSHGYSSAKGDLLLIDTIIKHDNLKADSDNIMIGNGSKTLAFLTLKLLLEKGDKVCIFRPFYPAYLSLLIDFESQITYLESSENYLDVIKDTQPILVILTSPNNPDGYTFSKIQLQKLSKLTKELNASLIIDEAYRNFIYNNILKNDLLDFEYDDHLIVLRTFSKELAICGWRIAYIIASKTLIEKISQIQLSFFNPLNPVMQRALQKYLKSPELDYSITIKNNFLNKLDMVCKAFSKRDINIVCPMGGFYLFLVLNINDTQTFCLNLAKQTGIIVWPGIDFGKNNAIRMSIAKIQSNQIERMTNIFIDYLENNQLTISNS
ncbi:MAG: hypothetical protein COB02_14000 [Candidatus Cloacimonadota bacterium]|nr:MAG: hypothetical protein COB02_14000 [Candidatus Cloacimonadota bacterium]